MKKLVHINSHPNLSIGNIIFNIINEAEKKGYLCRCYTVPSRHYKRKVNNYHYSFSSIVERKIHKILSYYTGNHGLYSYIGTNILIHNLKKFKPDIIHLHNLHPYYINLPYLFNYIKKHNIKTIWTLHDCWSFTGQCPYFDIVNCDKWKTGCYECPQIHEYPASRVDKTKEMWQLKKEWFTDVEDLTIVTPSKWLADLVKQSFLKEYPVKVINNGIDLNVFKPIKGNFREKYNIKDKYILLGIAASWGKRKGFDVFVQLAKRLPVEYQIVLVGTDDEIKKQLPENIIAINRTENQRQLAEIYTAADVFINPTREENFPTVNIEALACGTPVITFNTGGSPEIIDETCGFVVPKNDVENMIKKIYHTKESFLCSEACVKRAKRFKREERFKEYVELYQES